MSNGMDSLHALLYKQQSAPSTLPCPSLPIAVVVLLPNLLLREFRTKTRTGFVFATLEHIVFLQFYGLGVEEMKRKPQTTLHSAETS